MNKSLCFDCPVKDCKVKTRGIVEHCSKRLNYRKEKKK